MIVAFLLALTFVSLAFALGVYFGHQMGYKQREIDEILGADKDTARDKKPLP